MNAYQRRQFRRHPKPYCLLIPEDIGACWYDALRDEQSIVPAFREAVLKGELGHIVGFTFIIDSCK